MISQLTGKITYQSENYIIIQTSGVGYKVFVSNDTIKKLKEEVILWTYLAVRENSLDLYGFVEKSDLDFFELLISVSGIGPKSAIGIFNVASPDTLRSAIASNDTTYLTKVSGIGPKSAQKIVLELKDKVEKVEGDSQELNENLDVIDALQALGYSPREASDALKKISSEAKTTSQKVTEALKILGK